MDDWKEIRDGRLQKAHPAGFVVIKPKESKPPIPFFCPVCTRPMRKADDGQYYRKYECCSDCGVNWAEKHRDRWQQGWRPKNP